MADKRRRKSLRLFRPRPDTPNSTTTTSATDLSSSIERQYSENHVPVSPVDSEAASPRVRPRTLQKAHRSSIFGSWRSLQSLDEDEQANLTKVDSKASSLQEEKQWSGKALLGEHVKKCGEVQAPYSSLFKKRTQYAVLTESHLIRFKNHSKAAEMFPSISNAGGKPTGQRGSTSSFASYTDMQMGNYLDITQGIPLDEIVAVYRLEDGRPFFTVEISYLDERNKRSSTMQLGFNDPRDADSWISAMREGRSVCKMMRDMSFNHAMSDYAARALEREKDFDPLHFKVFTVVQRGTGRNLQRIPSDETHKTNTSIWYLAIGMNLVHLLPIPRISKRSSATSLSDSDTSSSFGIITLTSAKLVAGEDCFQLKFRTPLKQPHLLSLASCEASQILLSLRYSSEYLRPEWTVQPFTFDVPSDLEDQMEPPDYPNEDNNCFDRTLIAFCSAFDVDVSRIYYSVHFECEDAPCFRLLPASGGNPYNTLELLAVFRALRYNEAFTSLSFANIDLWPLREVYDPWSSGSDSLCTRSGNIVNLAGHSQLSVLSQEIRALTLKNRKLRRLDFSHAMIIPSQKHGERQDSGIPEAVAPLCKKSLTNLDWITFTGIQLSDTDVNFMVDAASERQCHFRALEIGDCGLSVHDIDVLLSTLSAQENTMEVIDICGAQGRFSPELFQRAIGVFGRIRKLNLTRVQKTSGNEPLISPEILLGWRLESLHLSHMPLNERSVDAVAAYLSSTKSDTLRELYLNQCGLTGRDLAILFKSMTRTPGSARKIHVSANENRLGRDWPAVSSCIAQSCGPTSLTLRMMEFEKEIYFRELVFALTKNTTIRSLDISRASLPYDASPETCEALKDMFATNRTLEELDISGEQAHLDATRFGIGLNVALLGLEHNNTLQLLKIEHQSLGLQGANTLAGVIEKNKTLLEIHCGHNEINLQSFTVLVNALEKNKTILFMPTLDQDRIRSMEKVKEEFELMEKVDDSHSPKIGALKKSMVALAHKVPRHQRHVSSASNHSNISFTEQDVTATMMALEESWQAQVATMRRYLLRNCHFANGFAWDEHEVPTESSSAMVVELGLGDRPNTQDSFSQMFANMKMDRTPRAEKKMFYLERSP